MYTKQSTANPLGKRPWNFALSNNGLNFYEAAQFPVPYPSRSPSPSRALNLSGLGQGASGVDYQPSAFFVSDPSTLPPAPQGMQYVQNSDGVTWILQPIPQTGPSPAELLLLLGAGAAALWYFTRKKKIVSLPVVTA